VISIGFAALDFFLLNQKNGEDRQAIALTTQIQVLSQQTAKFALESADGNTDSFKELEGTATPSIRPCSAESRAIRTSGMQGYATTTPRRPVAP
jgi:twitching motility protein PilJ